ncbi:MAG: M20/M25/M40 family metallo-hydrolase [Crocinitomicaceae bacterium]|jgi:carboxypeptidase Q|nr:M20/M25/M40 family metallo-hydrolase [Crocinitomicaceae bacterium]MDP4797525.1 M20/M25/M40 family metallo-hydrolase [Crocinitomicaceae bacterium]MDP4865656.1 M20/M25/M40 family metallo-hydrolase [Crocinitomicaceae bacterium]
MKILSSILLFITLTVSAQNTDSLFIRSIYNQALSEGKAYEDLRSLCKDIGARLSGSAEAQMAIEWSKLKMESYGFDKVYLQEIKVPHWERGTKESAWIREKNGKLTSLNLLALGGSIGTDGILEGEIVEFTHLDELKKAKRSDVEGKIVFLNQPMDEQQINTFKAYGGCYAIRGNGAVEGAKLGAKAVIIRSLGMPIDDHPHTGSMHYEEDVPKIPAAAVSTKDAEMLSCKIKEGKSRLVLEMDCRSFPDATSFNVIAEITGKENPNEIITFGGHLDSWDTGEGAHDDGAGVIHCLEALRILKELKHQPKHTLRVVFFMNEENGNMGGKTYATWSKERGENQIAALESDRGGFAPRGFNCDGTAEQVKLLETLAFHFKPYELHIFEKGYGGVDIGPLKTTFEGIPLFGFVPDSQRYFDFHHAPSDVFENVNKRELELGCGAIGSFIYLLDKNL